MAIPIFLGAAIWAGFKVAGGVLIQGVLTYFGYTILLKFSSVITSWGLNLLQTSGLLGKATVHFTGLAAWFIESLRIPECFSLYMSFAVITYLVSLVRR